MGGSTIGSPSREYLERLAGLQADEVLDNEVRFLSVYEITHVGCLAVTTGNIELADSLAQYLFTTAVESTTAPYNRDCARGYQTIQQQLDAAQVVEPGLL